MGDVFFWSFASLPAAAGGGGGLDAGGASPFAEASVTIGASPEAETLVDAEDVAPEAIVAFVVFTGAGVETTAPPARARAGTFSVAAPHVSEIG